MTVHDDVVLLQVWSFILPLYSNRRRVPCVVHPLHDGGGGAAAAEHGNVVEEVHAAVRPGPVPDEELEVGAALRCPTAPGLGSG